ncbi:class I tRNA ligase family protein [Candidatus Nomurabacteria bacterium]|nr:class I tRNA ligase family protein [Candidatus Nomurabacteria bacterium]
MDDKLLKPYQPEETEERIYDIWQQGGFFDPDKLPERYQNSEPYTIVMAPPNVTGSLHMGHALEHVISDILIRFERMRGRKALWIPGTDHAGIATQNVVEKSLKKEGISRHEMGREKFLEKVWEWKEKYGGTILEQLKQLGCSADWSRTRFTMDEKYQEAVKQAFLHYQKTGLIYRGKRVINWCIKDQTALSDLELEYQEEAGTFYYFKYGPFVIGTARPETKFGDKYVVVHPNDKRYAGYQHGQKLELEWINGPITATVIKDEAIDIDFGTGAMTITPAHSLIDFEIAERHGLDKEEIIDQFGKLLPLAGEFSGMKINEAREKIVAKLKSKGLLEREESLTHNVAKCYRCNSTVEPLLSEQWFLKMKPLAERALAAIEKGEVKYHPERWREIAREWLLGIRDWCISRQIWWGHKIPVDGSEDTFDTWFSSALWSMEVVPKEFYPTQVITSARDILHLWISRMIISGLEFTNQVPFKDILIHATVLNKQGQRMSKSLGTGLDPLEMIKKYGADATRFGLIYQEFGGQEIRFGEDNLLMGKKFANKIWNIARYILSRTDGKISSEEVSSDSEILEKLEETKREVTKNLEQYKFGEASHLLYDFVWHDLADKYLEESKNKNDEATNQTLAYLLDQILRLLHPFMPFVTEEIWSLAEKTENNLLMISRWSTRATSS